MSKLQTVESKKQVISALRPLEIQLGAEGYLLREDGKQYTVMYGLNNFLGTVGCLVIFLSVPLGLLLQIFPGIWTVFIAIPIFLSVYRLLKLALDESTRYALGTRLGFMPAEVIFSYYPLKIGENDRVTFRRRLKENFWTNLFKINKFPMNSRIKVSLACIERASYTKGTDNITDVAVVYEKVIYSKSLISSDHEVKGYFDLEIPLDFSPSFERKHNQIRWILNIEESYPNLLEQKVTHLTFVVDP